MIAMRTGVARTDSRKCGAVPASSYEKPVFVAADWKKSIKDCAYAFLRAIPLLAQKKMPQLRRRQLRGSGCASSNPEGGCHADRPQTPRRGPILADTPPCATAT
jgi:hypothetical protein